MVEKIHHRVIILLLDPIASRAVNLIMHRDFLDFKGLKLADENLRYSDACLWGF
jgi:hypothetical protein